MNLQPQIQKVFDILKAIPSLKVFASIGELDKYLDTMQKAVQKQSKVNDIIWIAFQSDLSGFQLPPWERYLPLTIGSRSLGFLY